MSNPYESPYSNFPDDPSRDSKGLESIGRTGMVSQVTVVAILLIVQGVLALLTGGGYVAMGAFFPQMWEDAVGQQMEFQHEIDRRQQEQNLDQAVPPEMPDMANFTWYITAYYIGAGVAGFLAGLFAIVAGIMNLQYKWRGFGIFALLFGFLASATIYCAPTAIAMGIYGLIVYFNSDVSRAFQLVKQGHTPRQVKDAALGIEH